MKTMSEMKKAWAECEHPANLITLHGGCAGWPGWPTYGEIRCALIELIFALFDELPSCYRPLLKVAREMANGMSNDSTRLQVSAALIDLWVSILKSRNEGGLGPSDKQWAEYKLALAIQELLTGFDFLPKSAFTEHSLKILVLIRDAYLYSSFTRPKGSERVKLDKKICVILRTKLRCGETNE